MVTVIRIFPVTSGLLGDFRPYSIRGELLTYYADESPGPGK